MQEIVFIIHISAAICLICLVLIQHGKGADMGAAFGSGASNTVFGSIGSVPFLIKITALIAAIFFTTSITLGVMVAKKAKQETINKHISTMPFKK
jgi:preprotein translocase subunit SecG